MIYVQYLGMSACVSKYVCIDTSATARQDSAVEFCFN